MFVKGPSLIGIAGGRHTGSLRSVTGKLYYRDTGPVKRRGTQAWLVGYNDLYRLAGA